MRENQLLYPHRFRFTEAGDAKAYGNPADPDGWWVYDEAQIVRLPNARLAQLEAATGLPLVHMMEGVHNDTVTGNRAASWLVIHLASPDIAGPFETFEPKVLLIEWQRVQEDDNPSPLDVAPSPESSSSPTSPPAV